VFISATGIYETNQSEACKYICDHSKAKVVVVDGPKQLEKFLSISSELPELKALIMYGEEKIPEGFEDDCPKQIYRFSEFLELGIDISDSEVQQRVDSQKPNQTCSLIYTSGTTGNPKAVMISHDNLCWTAANMLKRVPRKLNNNDSIISYLPLSHIAAQVFDMYASLFSGIQVWFAQPDALKGSLGKTLKEVRPIVFFGVPRVWEKIYVKMQEVAKSNTGLKKNLADWAKALSLKYHQDTQYGSPTSGSCMSFYPIAKLILKEVHVALGLDRCIATYSGAAPLDPEIIHYFASIDILICEVFGQSECTGPHAQNVPKFWKIGSCGRGQLGTETKIDSVSGELCYRGRHIFSGYMNMEDKTKETIDSDGWLHSGDIAKIDQDGFIFITGRIKELIITAGGENVPSVPIENHFKHAMPALSNCMLIGDRRKFLSILFCLHVEVDAFGIPQDKLTGEALSTSKRMGSNASTSSEAKSCPKWIDYFDQGMKEANSKSTSRAQIVQKWALLPYDFSEKGGELTPTLKLKRNVTETKYKLVIEQFYA